MGLTPVDRVNARRLHGIAADGASSDTDRRRGDVSHLNFHIARHSPGGNADSSSRRRQLNG